METEWVEYIYILDLEREMSYQDLANAIINTKKFQNVQIGNSGELRV